MSVHVRVDMNEVFMCIMCVVQCGAVRYRAVRRSAARCATTQSGAVRCDAIYMSGRVGWTFGIIFFRLYMKGKCCNKHANSHLSQQTKVWRATGTACSTLLMRRYTLI